MVAWDVERILQFDKDEVDDIEGNAVVISGDSKQPLEELN